MGHSVRLPAAASVRRLAALRRRVCATVVGADRAEPAVLYPLRTLALLVRPSHAIPHLRLLLGHDPRRTVARADRGRERTVCLQGRRRHLVVVIGRCSAFVYFRSERVIRIYSFVGGVSVHVFHQSYVRYYVIFARMCRVGLIWFLFVWNW